MTDTVQKPPIVVDHVASRQRLSNILFLYFQIEVLEDKVMMYYQGEPLREIEGLTPKQLQEDEADAVFLGLLSNAVYRQMAGHLFTEIDKHRYASKEAFPWGSGIENHPMYIKCETHAANCCVSAAKELAIHDVKAHYDSEH